MSSAKAEQMAKRITVDQLQSEIMGILNAYNENVTDGTKDAVREVAKWGANEVKAASRAAFNGRKYANGWTSQVETGRMSAQGAIYNGKLPGLPHLLENGHAKRNGGFVSGKTHIKPVEEQVIKVFEETVKKNIEGA